MQTGVFLICIYQDEKSIFCTRVNSSNSLHDYEVHSQIVFNPVLRFGMGRHILGDMCNRIEMPVITYTGGQNEQLL